MPATCRIDLPSSLLTDSKRNEQKRLIACGAAVSVGCSKKGSEYI